MDDDYLEKLGITAVPGRKGPNDRIFYYHGKPITMKEFGILYALICKNEDELSVWDIMHIRPSVPLGPLIC